MKCHSLDCTTSHLETNTQYRAYFNQQQNAIFTSDVERESASAIQESENMDCTVSVFTHCLFFPLYPVFSLLLMSTPCFIVLLWEERTPLQRLLFCEEEVRQGDKNYRLLWLLRQIAYKLFIFSLLLKPAVITKACPSVMLITIQCQAAPLLCFHLSHCLSVSLLLSFCTPQLLCVRIFYSFHVCCWAVFSVEHAAEIMNDVSGLSCLSEKILSSPVDKRRSSLS